MIRSDNNESIELHKHNVRFDENSKEIIIDAGTETFWMVPIRYHTIGYTKKALVVKDMFRPIINFILPIINYFRNPALLDKQN